MQQYPIVVLKSFNNQFFKQFRLRFDQCYEVNITKTCQ